MSVVGSVRATVVGLVQLVWLLLRLPLAYVYEIYRMYLKPEKSLAKARLMNCGLLKKMGDAVLPAATGHMRCAAADAEAKSHNDTPQGSPQGSVIGVVLLLFIHWLPPPHLWQCTALALWAHRQRVALSG